MLSTLAQALAHHTSRSILCIALSRIQTNAELQDMVFDELYNVKGEDIPVRLRHRDLIYVLEDVDASNKVVHRRESDSTRKEKTTVTFSRDGTTESAPAGTASVDAIAAAEKQAMEMALRASALEASSAGKGAADAKSGQGSAATLLWDMPVPDKLDLSGARHAPGTGSLARAPAVEAGEARLRSRATNPLPCLPAARRAQCARWGGGHARTVH